MHTAFTKHVCYQINKNKNPQDAYHSTEPKSTSINNISIMRVAQSVSQTLEKKRSGPVRITVNVESPHMCLRADEWRIYIYSDCMETPFYLLMLLHL